VRQNEQNLHQRLQKSFLPQGNQEGGRGLYQVGDELEKPGEKILTNDRDAEEKATEMDTKL
jgi:hypothetical protein